MADPLPQAPKKEKADALIGATLVGKYSLIKKLGEGGMGAVYMAKQAPIDRLVAVKVLLGKLAEDEVAVRRFEQEAKAVSKMQHPNTVTIYDYGQTEDARLYIVMEFLKGKALSDLLRSTTVLDPGRAIHIIRQVCASLSDAHAAGIIHRDIKPDNIFLTEVGGDKDFVKVLDFGVAKLADNEAGATMTQTGMIFGTPKYMSPEQAEGKPIDYRADIYAIGVVLYEMLVGRPPFLADTPVGLLLKHIQEPPTPFKKIRPDLDISPHLEAIVMKTLEKNPDQRFTMVADLGASLEACLRGMTTGVFPVAASGMPTQPLYAHGAVPTEVVPGQQGGDLSPGGLRPPQHVPSGMSLGIGSNTPRFSEPPMAHGGVPTAATGIQMPAGPATGLNFHGVPTEAGFGTGVTPTGMTNPVAIQQGGGVETLGGMLPNDASGPLRAPAKPINKLFIGGGASALVLGAAIVYAVSRPPEIQSIEAAKIPIEAVDPGPAKNNPPTAAVPTTPDPTPAPTKPDPSEPNPKHPVTNDHGKHPKGERASNEPAPSSKKVSFSFESTPSGAVVELDGKQLGRTPFTRDFAKELDVRTFVFKLDGHETKRESATLGSDRTIHVTLGAVAAGTIERAPTVTSPPLHPDPPKVKAEKKPNEEFEKVDDIKDM